MRVMTEFNFKNLVPEKFWIVEKQGQKVGTLQKQNGDGWVFLTQSKNEMFDTKEKLIARFGLGIFQNQTPQQSVQTVEHVVHGYPTVSRPYNGLYDVKRQLPLFTKSPSSKSLYCAGYYIIKFEKGWVKSFCPKLLTLTRYSFQGPMKTELEMRQLLADANRKK